MILPRYKRLASPRQFVVEQDPVRCEYAVTLPVIPRHPVCKDLGSRVRAARLEGGDLALRRGRAAEHLTGRCLVEAGLDPALADRLQYADRAQSSNVRSVFGHVEAHAHVRLRRQVIDLLRLDAVDQFQHISRGGNIPIMQMQVRPVLHMRIFIDMIDAVRVECAGTPDGAMHFVAFAQQQLRQVGAVLTGDPGDQRFFHFFHLYLFVSERSSRLPCVSALKHKFYTTFCRVPIAVERGSLMGRVEAPHRMEYFPDLRARQGVPTSLDGLYPLRFLA